LESFNNRGKLAKDLIGLLVVFDLSLDQLGEVAKGLGGVENLEKKLR
jgi:hypothetical protein